MPRKISEKRSKSASEGGESEPSLQLDPPPKVTKVSTAQKPKTPMPPQGWDDTVKPLGTRVKLMNGRFMGEVGVVERHQRVTRPGWDEVHHWVRLDTSGLLKLYAARFLIVL